MKLTCHQPRQQDGRRDRSRRRGVRPARAARHPRAHGQLAARQAPRRHAQDQGHQRHQRHDQEALTSRRAPATRARAACARRSSAAARVDLRPGRAQPRARPAEEGAQARAQDGAVGQAGRRQAGRDRRRSTARTARPRRSPSKLAKLGWTSALIIDGPAVDERLRAGGRATCRASTCCRSRAPTSTTSCAATRWC